MWASKRGASPRRALESVRGWITIVASTARDRPAFAASLGVGLVAALPLWLILLAVALAIALATFAALALPLGAATALWWLATGRGNADPRGTPRRLTARARSAFQSVLSSVTEASEEGGGAPGGGHPADLLLVHAGRRDERLAEGCPDAARVVAERIAARIERDTILTVDVVDVAEICAAPTTTSSDPDARPPRRPRDAAAGVVFVVEAAARADARSEDQLRNLRRAMIAAADDPNPNPASTSLSLDGVNRAVVAVSRSVGAAPAEGGGGPARRRGSLAGAAFGAAFEAFLDGDGAAARGSRRLCARCDAEFERDGPGVVDRWCAEVLIPALAGEPPRPPRVLSLSSSHTNLLVNHLGAGDRLVGCDAFYRHFGGDDDAFGFGGTDGDATPRIDPWNPDLRRVRELNPSLIVCAYEAQADALRAIAPRWTSRAVGSRRDFPGEAARASESESRGKRSLTPGGEARGEGGENTIDDAFTFEVAVLPCPLGRDAVRLAGAQISEVAALARVPPATARAARDALERGVLSLRAEADLALAAAASRAQPWVFVEADPDLYTADSCTPLGAALADALGVGNVADDPDDPRPQTHYPRLPAAKFWTPREPDWWIVAHPTSRGEGAETKFVADDDGSNTRASVDGDGDENENGGATRPTLAFADRLDPEERKRHKALRDGRIVYLSDRLCHAASQWTPELVDVARRVLDAMVAAADHASTESIERNGRRAAGDLPEEERRPGVPILPEEKTKTALGGPPPKPPAPAPALPRVALDPAPSLRAQLEPLSTVALRRRLVEDFGQSPTDPETATRSEVMAALLECYAKEARAKAGEKSPESESSSRAVVDLAGAPVSEAAVEALRRAIEESPFAREGGGGGGGGGAPAPPGNERPGVDAEAYVVLRAPADFVDFAAGRHADADRRAAPGGRGPRGSRKARKAAEKFRKYAAVWEAAKGALREVDASFADAFTALAVTRNFRGSPHVDEKNAGPFYAMALGEFRSSGEPSARFEGALCVERDARTVARVDTRNRLARADGRFPHWVAPYPKERREGANDAPVERIERIERISLVFFKTAGEPEPITRAVFEEHLEEV